MDFSLLLESGETISAVSNFTATPAGLTIGTPAISGTKAQARISGGTDGVLYHVTVTITTSAGNTRSDCGDLLVRAC